MLLEVELGAGELTEARRKAMRAVEVLGDGVGEGEAEVWFKMFAIVVEVAFTSVTLYGVVDG
jgi:hypothetical protein